MNSEIMTTMLSRENITLALSIFGSLGTLFTAIYSFLTKRRRLQMRIIGHLFGDSKMLILYVAFDNKSRLPISISDISVNIDDVWYPCVQPPIVVLEETEKVNGIITSHHEHLTLSMPINLASLGGTSGYICFEFPPAAFRPTATQMKFLISSNRGKAIEKTLSLGRHLDQYT